MSNTSNTPRVLVMMATYNGERYLGEQVDSILAQEGVDVWLRVCDDRSTDGTYRLLQELAARHPNVAVSQNQDNLGVGKNFMQMVFERTERAYDFYAFSDQDDVWLPNKLSEAIALLEGHDEPALYYSDVRNFSDEGESLELRDYHEVVRHPATLLLRSWACGCTMVFNRALRELLCEHPLDEYPRIHDTWVHLVALNCGRVEADIARSFIRRRLSGANVVGELSDHHRSLTSVFADVAGLFAPSTRKPSRVAQQLVQEFGTRINPVLQPELDLLLNYRSSLVNRVRAATRFDFWQPTRRGRALVRLCFLLGRY